jgi:dUTP pyrophosphatase
MLIMSDKMIDSVNVKFEKTHPGAKIPIKATNNSAYYDIFSAENVILPPHIVTPVHTGLKLQAYQGYYLDIRPRSGLALKHGITINNSPGTIDNDFADEVIIIMINHSEKVYKISSGDRIAQLGVLPMISINFVSERISGEHAGFGSTGA